MVTKKPSSLRNSSVVVLKIDSTEFFFYIYSELDEKNQQNGQDGHLSLAQFLVSSQWGPKAEPNSFGGQSPNLAEKRLRRQKTKS